MTRNPSCLISCSHWLPEGSLSVLVGRHGATNPAGRVRRILVCSRVMISSGRSLGEGEEMSELEPTSERPDKTPTREVRFPTRIKNALFAAGLKTVGEV